MAPRLPRSGLNRGEGRMRVLLPLIYTQKMRKKLKSDEKMLFRRASWTTRGKNYSCSYACQFCLLPPPFDNLCTPLAMCAYGSLGFAIETHHLSSPILNPRFIARHFLPCGKDLPALRQYRKTTPPCPTLVHEIFKRCSIGWHRNLMYKSCTIGDLVSLQGEYTK